MIDVFIGTKAQYIKTAPLLRMLSEQREHYHLIDSGQHADFTRGLRASLGVKEPDVCLADNGDIASVGAAIVWMIKQLFTALFQPTYLREAVFSPGAGYCVIHGDTPSTLIALIMARRAGKRVAHLESGLSSFRWYRPFPEEMIRQLCARYCDLLFAPSDWAAANLEAMGVPGEIINIGQNTNVEALYYALGNARTAPRNKPYALVTIHRVETILSRRRLTFTVELVRALTERLPVTFVLHPPTVRKLKDFKLMKTLEETGNLELLSLMDHGNFLSLLRDAEFVITDGGSIQEEAYYLDTPCLVLRSETERQEGLGENVQMGQFDRAVIENFIAQYTDFRRGERTANQRPSRRVLDKLLGENL